MSVLRTGCTKDPLVSVSGPDGIGMRAARGVVGQSDPAVEPFPLPVPEVGSYEEFAKFIGDAHERDSDSMKEDRFASSQDLLNNEYGKRLGKMLMPKYSNGERDEAKMRNFTNDVITYVKNSLNDQNNNNEKINISDEAIKKHCRRHQVMKALPIWFLLLCSILLSVSCKNKSYKQGSLKIGDENFDIGVPNSRFFSCLLGSKDSTYKADQTTWFGKNDCNGLIVVRRLVNAEAHGWYENQLLLEPDSGVIWASTSLQRRLKKNFSGFPSQSYMTTIL